MHDAKAVIELYQRERAIRTLEPRELSVFAEALASEWRFDEALEIAREWKEPVVGNGGQTR